MDFHKRRLVRSLQVSAPRIKQRLPSRIVPRAVLERALVSCGVGVTANAVLAGIVDRCAPAGSASTTTAVDTEILFKVVERAAEQLGAEDVEFWDSYFGDAQEVSWGALRAALLSRVLARASDLDARRSMSLLRRRLDPNNCGKVTRDHALEFFADVGGVEVVGMPEELAAVSSPRRGESPPRSPEDDCGGRLWADHSGSCSRETSPAWPETERNTRSTTYSALAARAQTAGGRSHSSRDGARQGAASQGGDSLETPAHAGRGGVHQGSAQTGPYSVRSDESGPASVLYRPGDCVSPGRSSQRSKGDSSLAGSGRGLMKRPVPASARPHCLARGPALMKLAALLERQLTCALRQSCQASFIVWRRSIVPRAPPRARAGTTRRLPAKTGRRGGDLPSHDSSTSTTASLPSRSERSSPVSIPAMPAPTQLEPRGSAGVPPQRGASCGGSARSDGLPRAIPSAGETDLVGMREADSHAAQHSGRATTGVGEPVDEGGGAGGAAGDGRGFLRLSARAVFRTLQSAGRRRLGQSFAQLRRLSDAHAAQKAYIEHFDNGMFNVSKQAQAIVGVARVLLRASRRQSRILFSVAQADSSRRLLEQEREAFHIRAHEDHQQWVAELNKRDAELQNIKEGVSRRRRVQRQTQLAFAVTRLSQVLGRAVRDAFNRISIAADLRVSPGTDGVVSAEVVRQSVAAALLVGTVSRAWQRHKLRMFTHLQCAAEKASGLGDTASLLRRARLASMQKGPASARVSSSPQRVDALARVASARTSRSAVQSHAEVTQQSLFGARSPPSQLFSSRLTFDEKHVCAGTKQEISAAARLRGPSQEARDEALRAWTGSGEESLLASSRGEAAAQSEARDRSHQSQKSVDARISENDERRAARHGHPPLPKAAGRSRQIQRKIEVSEAPQIGMQRAASTSCLPGSSSCQDKDSGVPPGDGPRLGHSSSASVLSAREAPLLHARGGGLYGSNGVSLQSVDFYDPAVWLVSS
mmetsp:Transcript_75700/g.202478  ORF Transcript_75700/g.202478 Transcript_75700/m.202478 type:complete len:987 (-) Transcript_75700:92-3052(-)